MSFEFIPDEAQAAARIAIAHYKKKKFKIKIEHPFSVDAPYCTTFIARKSNHTCHLVEVQAKFSYNTSLKELSHWIASGRHNCEFYIAIKDDTSIQAEQISTLKSDGVGLFQIHHSNKISALLKAKNFAFAVTPDPLLKFGKYDEKVKDAIEKFNEDDRKDGLRDLCEVFEQAVEELGIKLIKKSLLNNAVPEFCKKSLENQINIIAQTKYAGTNIPVLAETDRTDLQSFRTARNLIDHKVKTHAEQIHRECQYVERIPMGARLIAILLQKQKKIK